MSAPDSPSPGRFRPARRMARLKASAVREILKVTEQPEIVSFAGGLPAPELFPVEAFARAHADVLATDGAAALQYSTTEGFAPLRAWVAERLGKRGVVCDPEQVLITAGSQQGIDLTAKVLIDPGDLVVVESPTYLAALQAFDSYEASFATIRGDEGGADLDDLERTVNTVRPKLIYLVPEFQNPSGITLAADRRARLLELAARHDIPVVEDYAYGELRYRGVAPPPLAAIPSKATVIHLGTFSKTLAPGLRIGWVVAPSGLVRRMAVAKQAVDLHTNTIGQRVVSRLLETFDYEGHLATLRKVYGERCAAMLAALDRHFPSGSRWTRPEGGLFVWGRLPGRIAAEVLLEDALRLKVAFVPGAPFFASNPPHDFLRLNFSNRTPEVIEDGIARLGRALASRLTAEPGRAPLE
jgi:2-aminoadipate transaminase